MNRFTTAALAVAGALCLLAPAAITQELEGPQVFVEEQTVVVAGDEPAVYLLVSHHEGEVIDTRLIYGAEAAGEVEGAGHEEVSVDVFRVDALGTLEGVEFKPCIPREDADEPDCTPGDGFPPIAPPRFERIEQALR